MTEIFLIIFSVLSLINIAFSLYLLRKNNKLKQDYAILSDAVERNHKDIAGLCSAAVSVDTKLTDNHEQLLDIAEQVAEFPEQEESTSQPYHVAIQKVRNGADANELIQQCGLTQEEAILLIRLHGSHPTD